MEVRNPLFIVGTGRCGSTVLFHILSHHPHVSWLSQLCVKYPGRPEINRLAMQVTDLPLPSRFMRKAIYPGEWYPFWEYYYRGFSEPCRDLYRDDVTESTKAALREVLGKMLTDKRNRLLIKITGWPRFGFLKEIFPDAKFIHINRDGRAVANSWLNVRWWSGWRGPHNWRWGELTSAQQEKWERYGRSFVVLAAIGWEILMTAFEDAKRTIPPEDVLEIRYEAFCEDPAETLQRVAEFCALEWLTKFGAIVRSFSLRNSNDKWQKELNPIQQRMLCESLSDALAKYGYSNK